MRSFVTVFRVMIASVTKKDGHEKTRPDPAPQGFRAMMVSLFIFGTPLTTIMLFYGTDQALAPSAIAAAAIMAGICGVYGLGHYALTQWRLYRGTNTGIGHEGDTRPLLPRHRQDARTPMDGSRLTIFYTDAEGQDTKRTIRCQELGYHQDGSTITPFLIEAYCELRDEERTFIPRRIARATLPDGTPLFDITAFLVAHADLPRQEGPAPTNVPNGVSQWGPKAQAHTQTPAEAPPKQAFKSPKAVLAVRDGLVIVPPSLRVPEDNGDELYSAKTLKQRIHITYAREWSRSDIEESIIHPTELTYFLRRKRLYITEIDVFSEQEKGWDLVPYRDILSATDLETGQSIENLGLFMLGENFQHIDPNMEEEDTYPDYKDIKLKDTPLALTLTRRGTNGEKVTLTVNIMTLMTPYPYNAEDTELTSLSGENIKTGAQRTIRTERITSVHDPETGESVDDLLAFLETRRKRKAKA